MSSIGQGACARFSGNASNRRRFLLSAGAVCIVCGPATVVEMVVNRRVAQAMNLVLPPEILIRADRIVDT